MTKRVLIVILSIMIILTCFSQPMGDSQSTTISPSESVEVVNRRKQEEMEAKESDFTHKTVILSTGKVIKKINIRISHYTNSYADCLKTDGISASGKHLPTLSRGGVQPIAAPKSVPFGTKMYIEGVGHVQVEDRGGAIKYTTINGEEYMKVDLFVPNVTAKQISDMGIILTTGYIIGEVKDESRIDN